MSATWRQALAITRKELRAYFGSPMALIFVGAFLIATLFVFFWANTFFARNIADVRPLFSWMPVLMIFLVAALTMRQWSDEQRAGTLEVLLTLPVRRSALVLGKFLAVLSLVVVSLALTLFLPITVSILGNLDWGPVVGGYLAAILLAAAYTTIGLYISSRTDNQIVSLLLTALIGGVFYLIGTQGITQLVGDTPAEIFRAIGTGSRFESIERGVLDVRDLLYYLSLTAFFLVLNVVSLDSKGWSHAAATAKQRMNTIVRVALVGANLLALNVWMFPVHTLRADLTARQEYSLSPATLNLIKGLDEPLLIRGYFSQRTHPLLAPLVPALRDMMQEYEIASGGKIKVEILDPRDNPQIEAEANDVYGIRPTPFRVAGRYEQSVISSYFDVLVRYGDQHEVLTFDSLIEVKSGGGDQMEVGLRNPEYDLSRSIKKVVYGFQGLDKVFASVKDPVKLTEFITPATLPAEYKAMPALLDKVTAAIAAQAGGKLVVEKIDPQAPNSGLDEQKLYDTYGLQPFRVSPFSQETYYLAVVLQVGDKQQALYPEPSMTEANLRNEIEAGLRRGAPGFLKTVGLWTPPPAQDPYGQQSQPISSWQMIQQQLSQDYTVEPVDLSTGRVPGNIDVLLVVAPKGFTDKERFAIDQYLMRGGSVVIGAASYMLSPVQYGGGLLMEPTKDGVNELLASYGINVGTGLVLDPQNESFPVQVQRTVSGMSVTEMQQVPYPFFVDVRSDGMTSSNPVVSSLPAVTLQWVAPLEVDATKNKDRKVVTLLKSSANAWVSESGNVQPDSNKYPQLGFPIEGEQSAKTLAVSVTGSFTSYFKDHASPFAGGVPALPTPEGQSAQATPAAPTEQLGTVDQSPATARLIVVGSGEFLDDTVLQISRSQSTDRYLNNLQFMQNAIDWSVEDEDLLSIRSRGAYANLLRPLSQGQQSLWEAANYVVALLGLAALGVVWSTRRRHEEPLQLVETHADRLVEGER